MVPLIAARIPSLYREILFKDPKGQYQEKDYVAGLIKEKHGRGESLELTDMISNKANLLLLFAGIFHYGTWPNAVKDNTGLDIRFPPLEEVSPESIERVAYKIGRVENAAPI